MKKWIAIIGVMLCCFSGAVAAEWYQAVAKPHLVVRDLPDVTGDKVGKVPYGGKVKVLKRVGGRESIGGRKGYWVKIQWRNKTAYVFDAFLISLEEDEEVELWYRAIAKPSLVVRNLPDVTGKKIGNVPYGGKVKFVDVSSGRESIGGRKGRWFKIEWKGKTGFVFNAFLEPLD